MRRGEGLNMFSLGQKQCQRQKKAVGGLDSASPACWGSYLPATGLRLPEADVYLPSKGCQWISLCLRWGSCVPGTMAWVSTPCRWHKNIKHSPDNSWDTPFCPLFFFRPSRNSSLGIYSRHSSQSWEKSRINQVGRPVRRCLQIFKIWSCGSAVGKEEEQQQHDVWETQSGYEVSLGSLRKTWHIHRPTGWRICLTFKNDFQTAAVAFFNVSHTSFEVVALCYFLPFL